MRLDAELLKKTGIFALVSGELTVTIGGGYLLGNYLDDRFSSSPVMVGALTTVGLVYSVWRIYGFSRQWVGK